jgi:ABC-type lipoprotein release transport system permease subunit
MTNVMERMLYGVSRLDAVTFVAVPVILTAVAVLASLVPARRAGGVDPLVALRND